MIIKDKLKKIFNDTVEYVNNYYNGNLNIIPCFDLTILSSKNNNNYRFGNNNVCMLKYKYCNYESILMIFSIPVKINDCNNNRKNICERISEILYLVEDTFITLDYRQLIESKEDSYFYFICIKIINGE